MKRRTWILVLVLIGFVWLLRVFHIHGSYHSFKTENQQSVSTNTSIGYTELDTVKTYSKIAIVTPSVWQHVRDLQQETAIALKEKLSKTKLVYNINRTTGKYTASYPTVTIYSSVAEAKRHKPDMALSVEPKEWIHHRSIFLKGNYSAQVIVTSSKDPSGFGSSPIIFNGSMLFCFDMTSTVQLNGKMKGIFSTSDMTKNAAESIAGGVAKDMNEKLSDWVEHEATHGSVLPVNQSTTLKKTASGGR